MKALKSDLMALNGEVLNREQLKKVIGGMLPGGNGLCSITYLTDNGQGSYSPTDASVNVPGTCEQQMTACAAAADRIALAGGNANVHYDSGCDGWGH